MLSNKQRQKKAKKSDEAVGRVGWKALRSVCLGWVGLGWTGLVSAGRVG